MDGRWHLHVRNAGEAAEASSVVETFGEALERACLIKAGAPQKGTGVFVRITRPDGSEVDAAFIERWCGDHHPALSVVKG